MKKNVSTINACLFFFKLILVALDDIQHPLSTISLINYIKCKSAVVVVCFQGLNHDEISFCSLSRTKSSWIQFYKWINDRVKNVIIVLQVCSFISTLQDGDDDTEHHCPAVFVFTSSLKTTCLWKQTQLCNPSFENL